MNMPNIPNGVEQNAWWRQGGTSNDDALCARCGEPLDARYFKQYAKGGWYPTWRVSKQDGGNRKSENCVCLCPKCYVELRQNSSQTIPMKYLPYYAVKRPEW